MDGDAERTFGLSKESESPQAHHHSLDSSVHSTDSPVVQHITPSGSSIPQQIGDSSEAHTNSVDSPSFQSQKHGKT